MNEATKLTEPQQRLLDRVRRDGRVVQNGRARRTVEALEATGLVTVDWDLIPRSDGKWVEEITITPAI